MPKNDALFNIKPKKTMIPQEKEIEILKNIYQNQGSIRQRELSEIVGLSLGMTNTILKRCVQKGFLTIRKVNNRNIRYAVTPKGVEIITRRSYRFLKRTIKNIVLYKEAVEKLVREVKALGYTALVLVGKSDLDFLVEHACIMYDLAWIRNEHIPDQAEDRIFYLYSESYIPDTEEKPLKASEYLQTVFLA